MTSSAWKYLFLDYLHMAVPYPMSNWGYFWKFLKSWNFQKWWNFEVLANFFVMGVSPEIGYAILIPSALPTFWTFDQRCSLDINGVMVITKFDLLFDVVPNYLTFHLNYKWVSSDDQDTHLDQVWWWLVRRCDLYPANNVNPDRQTNRQTDRQMKKQSEIAYLPKFPKWWSLIR